MKNREIKLKGWDTIGHKWIIGSTEPVWRDGKISSEQLIFCQFTGLKDKQGKEIFEGDIIQIAKDERMVVSWNEQYASFCLDRGGWLYSHWFGESCDPQDCEVIGNIFENPEHLQEVIRQKYDPNR
jgi:hypothetical protein